MPQGTLTEMSGTGRVDGACDILQAVQESVTGLLGAPHRPIQNRAGRALPRNPTGMVGPPLPAWPLLENRFTQKVDIQ